MTAFLFTAMRKKHLFFEENWSESYLSWLQCVSNCTPFSSRMKRASKKSVDKNRCLIEYGALKCRRGTLIVIPNIWRCLYFFPVVFSLFLSWDDVDPFSNVCAKLQDPACPRSPFMTAYSSGVVFHATGKCRLPLALLTWIRTCFTFFWAWVIPDEIIYASIPLAFSRSQSFQQNVHLRGRCLMRVLIGIFTS